ncbi:MAG: zinc ribbon domain-containing protein [Candidatus Heimdallarchaeota archaeon]
MLKQKKSYLMIFSILLLTISLGISVTLVRSYSVLIIEDEVEQLVIEDLVADVNYDITVEPYSSYFSYDIGFTIHTNDDFDNNSKLITVDNPGLGIENIVFVVENDGDYYLETWITDDDGLLEITVKENDTGIEMDISTYYTTYEPPNLTWLWIVIGVIPFLLIMIVVVLVIVFASRAGKKLLDEARSIDYTQIEQPLTVIKKRGKRICPYCKIKLSVDAEIKCPYCGAPITEE